MADDQAKPTVNLLDMAREITVAWLSNPNVNATAEEVPTFLMAMHAAINELSNGPQIATAVTEIEFVPAVSIRSSVKPHYIISLINGQKFKTLKRHLALNGLTPADYRERYGLKSDYPMVAASYSEQRREVARKLGLGRKTASLIEEIQQEPTATAISDPAPAPAAGPGPGPGPDKPKRAPSKPRVAKSAVPSTTSSSKAIDTESGAPAAESVPETPNSEAVPKPAKNRRIFARPAAAQAAAPVGDAITILPDQKKPRAARKPKVAPEMPNGAEYIAPAPKRGRPKKQPTEA